MIAIITQTQTMKNIYSSFIFTVIALLLSISLKAQIAPYSKVLYDSQDNGMQVHAATQSYDHSPVLVGTTSNLGFIMKLNNTGDPLWTKGIKAESNSRWPNFTDIIPTSDSCFFILGDIYNITNEHSDALFIKMNLEGEILWSKTNNLGGLISVSETLDGGFILTGYQDFASSPFAQLSVVKIDQNGGLEWSRVMSFGTLTSRGFSASQKENGHYIISGYFRNENENRNTALLAELSSMGEVLWSHGFKNENIGYNYRNDDVIIHNNELYLLMSNDNNSILSKTDSLGNILFCKQINSSSSLNIGSNQNRKLHINSLDELFFIYSNWDGGFVKMDLNGEVMINSSLFLIAKDILFTEDNGLLAIGNGPLWGVKEANSTWETIGLIKMTSEGIGADCVEQYGGSSTDMELNKIETEYTVGGGGIATSIPTEVSDIDMTQRNGCVDFIGTTSDFNEIAFSVYPNPSTGFINFESGSVFTGNLQILNQIGQVIHEVEINQQNTKLDFNHLDNGIYFYKMEKNKVLIASDKFFIIK